MSNKGLGPQIVALLREGHSYKAIAKDLGCALSTVAYHADKAGLAPGSGALPWADIRAYYEAGASDHETRQHFDILIDTWEAAARRGEVTLRQEHTSEWRAVMYAINTGTNADVARLLLRGGFVPFGCSDCKAIQWRGEDIPLVADYVNGLPQNTPGNLCLRCLNCNAVALVPSRRGMTKRLAATLGRDISVSTASGL